VRTAVRFLDDVIDSTPYFFDENRKQQSNERRVGLGVMGLADLLIRLGIKYGSAECEQFLDKLFGFIAHEAYLASADIAAEKGSFPKFDAEKFLQSGFMRKMPDDVREAVKGKGCRNVTLLTVAPTGTTGTMVGTSTGVEPFFSWSYYRKSRLGMHEENVAVLKEWKEENGDIDYIPDFFTTAMDMTPEEHVRAQAAVQRWIDSSISKTCNVPNDYTVEQTRELYELMYDLGCKGGTIYRDGSRDVQVLNLKDDEKKAEEAAPKVEEPKQKVRERPYKRYGVTVSQASPSGTAHITMNDDADGRPFEVFVDIGKGGSDIKAMAEAMGRLMSLLLRISSPLSPKDRIQEIINQIKGIGGARSLGFGKNRVRSLPDAVALALEEHYGVQGDGNGGSHAEAHHADEDDHEPVAYSGNGHNGNGQKKSVADLCPECGIASFIRKEGCHTCESCGYSEC
jgi:ribonucleoside-diphosphate reductase alpha chain